VCYGGYRPVRPVRNDELTKPNLLSVVSCLSRSLSNLESKSVLRAIKREYLTV
jgi:hypothetical protein